jgi:hypothetical protein
LSSENTTSDFDDLVVALVTGPVENITIFLPSFNDSLSTKDILVFRLISSLASLEWSSSVFKSASGRISFFCFPFGSLTSVGPHHPDINHFFFNRGFIN